MAIVFVASLSNRQKRVPKKRQTHIAIYSSKGDLGRPYCILRPARSSLCPWRLRRSGTSRFRMDPYIWAMNFNDINTNLNDVHQGVPN